MKAQCVLPLGLLLALSCMAQQNAAELRQKAEASSGGECVHLNLQLAHDDLEAANRRFAASDSKTAHDALDTTLRDVQRAAECSLHTPKSQKNAEIELRKLSRRMGAIAQALEVDERSNLVRAQAEVEKQRDRLLHAIFGDAAASRAEKKP